MPSFLATLRGFRKALWKHRRAFGISLGITALAYIVYLWSFVGESTASTFSFVQRLELAFLDLRFQLRGTASPDPRIVIVAIDQRSQEVLGRWPFPRTHFADMLDALREDGARVVAFDITFSKPDEIARPIQDLRARMEARRKQGLRVDPALAEELARLEKQYHHDERFAEAVRSFGRVVLGNFFMMYEQELKGVDAATLDEYDNLVSYFPFPQVRATAAARGPAHFENLVQSFQRMELFPAGAQANIAVLSDALRGEFAATGFFNVRSDPDGVLRRAQLVLPYTRSANLKDADLYASMDVQAVRLFRGLRKNETVLNYGPLGVESIEFGRDLAVKTDNVGRLMINFQGPVGSYQHISLADVVRKTFPPGTFKDKIVLVGATATGISDLRSTPFGYLDYPGVEAHANVIDNILNQKFLVRDAQQVRVDRWLILLLGVPLGIWLALVNPRWMAAALLLALPLWGGIYFAFTRGWWLNLTMPLFVLVTNTGFVSLYRVLVEEREKRKVRGAFQQYLSPEVIRRLLENPDLVQPRKTEISVMFSDIRGFTSISEKLDAQDLALFLNDYLTDMTRIVFRNRGTLDKYIGDAVMAFWGAPYEEQGHAEKACRAALEMMERVGELQQQWAEQGKPQLDIGLGINTGVASVGNMGSDLRYGYTAMGDAVNLSSRLEGLNKEYGTHIIVSETTFREANVPEFVFRELDLIRVKGKIQPVTIYELLGRRDTGTDFVELAAEFVQARALYQQRRWQEAQTRFTQILNRWENDGPARAYWKRCQEYLFEEPPSQWDGVFTMTHK